MKILFLGDSITEAGRDRMSDSDLGSGFVHIFAGKLKLLYPDTEFAFFNRGVSGYTMHRVLEDVDRNLVCKPDIVVLLAGVNDVICRFSEGVEISPEAFEESFRAIVQKVKESGAKLVVLQPFVLNVPDKARYRRFFDKFLERMQKVVEDEEVDFIPLDAYFNGLCVSISPYDYAADGIHPTHRASRLIADNLIKTIRKFI